MNKNDTDTLYIDWQFFEDCSFIEYNSPNPAIDLLALMAIIYKRRIFGELKNWTDMPVRWGMDKFKVGYDKYSAALNRLVEWGIVQKSEGKKIKYRKQEMYKYVIRDDARYRETEIAKWSRRNYTQKEGINKETVEAIPIIEKQVLQHVETEGKVLHWTGKTLKFQKCRLEEMNASPICPVCHKHFLATESFQIQNSNTEHSEMVDTNGKPFCMLCGWDIAAAKDYHYCHVSFAGKVLASDLAERMRIEGNKNRD